MQPESHPLVVIPTYNEIQNIPRLLSEIFSVPSPFHVLIVDDGSPDGTAELVRNHELFEQRVFILKRDQKRGLGTAYRAGFQWALARNYTHIAQMDADLSHDPKDLERLLNVAKQTDLAIGSRYMKGGGVRGWAKRRELLSRCANLYARWVTGVPIQDLTGGFKCYRRETLAALDFSDLHSMGYAFQIETTTHVARQGFGIQEIPIVFHERTQGVSKMSGHVIWEAIGIVWKLRRKH